MLQFSSGPRLHTRRLTLRPTTPGDAAEIARLAGDPLVARMTTHVPHPYGLEDAEAFLACAGAAAPGQDALFAIETRAGRLAGLLGFHARADGAPEAGYWLGRPYWGRGYMTEALRVGLDWVRTGWGRRVVFAGHFADNDSSAWVLIKAGFLYTGDVFPRYSRARGEEVPTRMMVWLA